MKLKKLLALLTVYAIVIISVPFFFNDMWLKDFPELKTYEGELKFSGERAYKDIEYMGLNFPQREIGTENAESSANWILHEFKQLGLEAYKEEFVCRSSEKLLRALIGKNNYDKKDYKKLPLNEFFTELKGINVIGISKGKSKDTIIIGAHRDTLGTLEGAQDNASGTASMLELARVLTKEDHYYTYMFISFDGEEIGLKGSEAFARKHSLKNVKLAMILDCVGYKNADTVGLYQFASAKGASPLWTTVLANNVIKDRNGKPYYIDEEGGLRGISIGVFPPLMKKMMSLKVSGWVNTDSGPFVDRNIPSVGFIAANSIKKIDPENVYHTPGDTISMVRKDTLEFIGKLSEKYIKSVELNDFSWELESSWYLVKGNKYLDFRIILGFGLLVLIGVAMIWFVSSFETLKKRNEILAFVRKELVWIIPIVLLSVFFGFMWQIVKFDFAADINITFLIKLWLGVSFLVLLAIITIRFIILKDKRESYHQITEFQRTLLNSLYFLIFLAATIYFNVFIAIILVGIPVFVMGRVGYCNMAARIGWGIALLIWSVIETILLFSCVSAYIYDFLAIEVSVLMFIYSLLMNFTFVYVISTPFMPKKAKNFKMYKELNTI
ncbi:M28 family metallopeptidase [Acetivibrio clariflavus]|uniref:Putative aminopeptidase n=1 Tax=Acetivibrio clariflavus (strain DSM 19732 / NBRC 101661 / EBR45) TaxID=720554 RepID=G8M211_ACECE|nr:M28 family metallopeptidase [Acetivibrio clariflavus]AEV68129.1 putative aminopeptidase [Acetivibrio clariflavus DSM 19732]